jgi:hypothetical protein
VRVYGFVVVFVGSQLLMNLAVEIAGPVSGEHASNAHHPRGYTNERRLTLAPFFTPEAKETPIKAKRSAPSEFPHWLVPGESICPRTTPTPAAPHRIGSPNNDNTK